MPSTQIDRVSGVTTSAAIKVPCKVRATAQLVLNGEQTISGVACVSGDRVLQDIPGGHVDNGIWVVAVGSWSRASDFDGTRDVTLGTVVPIYRGAGTYELYALSNAGTISIGSTALTFETVDSIALQALLASSASGDALIAVLRHLTDAVATTVDAWIERQPVSPLDFGGVGNGVADDLSAFTKMAASGKPIDLLFGYNWVLSGPVTISADMQGRGMDTGQSTITLTGTGQLNVGDEHCDWGGFTIQSAVNNLKFINVEHSYFRSTRGLRFEGLSGATGQKGLHFDTTDRSVYQSHVPIIKSSSVDYPVFITGGGAEVFNDNHIGGPGSYFQDFASAITTEQQVATDANFFGGYFETGTNMLAHNAGALRQNRFRYIIDGVTRDLAITPAITDANLWERLDGGVFTVSGTYPQNQVFVGIPVTKVRATQATAQSINNSTATAMTCDVEVFDALSEFTPGSGLFTAKQTGYFRVRGAAMSASVAWDVGERWEVAIFKNAAEYARGIPSLADAATTRQRMSAVDCLVQLTVGDTLELMVLHNQGAAVNLNNSGLTNYLEIERVQ